MELHTLPVFTKAQIVAVQDCPIGKRLIVLGCCPGADILVTRRTMSGDTLVCELTNFTFGLRKDEAKLISVKLLAY